MTTPDSSTGNDLYDRLIRSARRRTVGITIKSNAEVHVHAPAWMSRVEIEHLISTRHEWIRRKRAEMQAAVKANPIQRDSVTYRGQKHPIIFRPDAQAMIYREESTGLIIDERYRQRRDTLVASWLQLMAEEHLPKRALALARHYDFRPAKVRIADTASQWGSCSASGNISLCWRLIMCPEAVSDYVILHELVHLRHLNHSQRFWQQVAELCPDFQTCRQWLRRNSRQLRQQP